MLRLKEDVMEKARKVVGRTLLSGGVVFVSRWRGGVMNTPEKKVQPFGASCSLVKWSLAYCSHA